MAHGPTALEDLDRLQAATVPIASRHGLDLVVVFGSQATRAVHAGSDVDLAVRHSDGVLDADRLDEVRNAFTQALSRPVDLVDLRAADPLLLAQIFKTARPLYERDETFMAERLRAFHRFEDYRPYLKLERDTVRRRLGLADG